jgi:hypothetical protein
MPCGFFDPVFELDFWPRLELQLNNPFLVLIRPISGFLELTHKFSQGMQQNYVAAFKYLIEFGWN